MSVLWSKAKQKLIYLNRCDDCGLFRKWADLFEFSEYGCKLHTCIFCKSQASGKGK